MRIKFLALLTLLALSTGLVAQVPQSKHIYIVALENKSYEHIVGSSNMPYLNSLFAKGTLATQFYANRHTSITDYFMVTSGVVPTTNDSTSSTYNVDNTVRHLMLMGLTFKVYAQTLPYAGYSGLSYNAYMKRHTALPYYTDMGNSTTEMAKLVPMGELATDIMNQTLPNFAFITPDANHDLHNCPNGVAACEQMADAYLKSILPPLLASPAFQPGGDGILIIWSDEADLSTDNRCSATVSSGCGGRVAVSMIGPKVRVGYKSTTTYHHQHVLKTFLKALGDTSFPGASSTATPMNDFFVTTTTSSGGVVITAPVSGATVGAPTTIAGYTSGISGVTSMKVYVDGVSKYSTSSGSFSTSLSLSSGSHSLTLKAWTSSGAVYSKSESFSVN